MSFDFSAVFSSAPFVIAAVLAVQWVVDTVFPFDAGKARPLLWQMAERGVLVFAGLLNNGGKGAVTQLLRGIVLLLFLLAGGFILGGVWSFVTALLMFAQGAVLFVCFYICLGFTRLHKIHSHLLERLGETPPERAEIVRLFACLGIPVPRISKEMSPYIKAAAVSAGYYMNILLTGPLFWFWLAGLYGMFSYVLVMAALIVLPRQGDSLFTLPLRLAAQLMDLLPGLITAALLYVAAFAAFRVPPRAALADLRQDPLPLLTNGLLAVTAVMASAAGVILGETAPHWYIGTKAAETVLGEEAADAEGVAQPEALRAALRLAAVFHLLLLIAAAAFSIKFAV
jgi:hypothetical protein